MSDHTPTPWRVDADSPEDGGHVLIVDEQDVSIARVYQQPLDTWTAEATAERIISCVEALEGRNPEALDEVLAAANEMVDRIHQSSPEDGAPRTDRLACALRDLLA